MSEQSTSIPQKGMWTIKAMDWVKGLGIALFGNIAAMGIYLVKQDHWPTYEEWQPYIVITVTTFFAYIGKNFTTNNVGNLFQKDQPVVHVNAEKLASLEKKAEAAEDQNPILDRN